MAAAIQLAKAGVEVDVFEAKPELQCARLRASPCRATRCACSARSACGTRCATQGYFFEGLTLRAPGPAAPVIAELPEVKTGGPDYPAAGHVPP